MQVYFDNEEDELMAGVSIISRNKPENFPNRLNLDVIAHRAAQTFGPFKSKMGLSVSQREPMVGPTQTTF